MGKLSAIADLATVLFFSRSHAQRSPKTNQHARLKILGIGLRSEVSPPIPPLSRDLYAFILGKSPILVEIGVRRTPQRTLLRQRRFNTSCPLSAAAFISSFPNNLPIAELFTSFTGDIGAARKKILQVTENRCQVISRADVVQNSV